MGKAIILEGMSFVFGNIGTVTIREDLSLQSLAVDVESSYTGMYLQCRVAYTPVNTNETGVTWSITSGGEYATINSNGLITIDESADNDEIVVRCESTVDSSIFATKTISVTYEHQSDYLTSIAITGDATVVLSEAQYGVTYEPSDTYMKGVEWSIVSGGDYATINSSTGKVTIKTNADASEVIIKAASIYDSAKYATKTLTLTYLDAIVFADPNMKAVCVANWDTDHNGEISHVEAEAVTSIGEVFKNNTNIVSFDEFRYFSNVSSWARASHGFSGCTSLKSITLPSSLTDLGGPTYGGKFNGCSSLERINLQNVTSFSDPNGGCGTFSGCSKLEDIGGLNNSVTVLGNACFKGCSKLPLTQLPSSLTFIASYAFMDCTLATFSVIPSGVTLIGQEALENIGSTVLDFSGCTSLTSIGTKVCMGCKNLQLVKLPSSITSIGTKAFYNGKAGLTVVCYAPYDSGTNKPSIASDSFTGTTRISAIYVPDASVDAYKAAENWSTYANKIHPISEYTE